MSRRARSSADETTCSGLEPRTRRWVDFEQTLNERSVNEAVFSPIDRRSNTVHQQYRPEQRAIWNQSVVWIPDRLARRYGPVDAIVRDALGVRPRDGYAPLFLHPQPPLAHRRLSRRYGGEPLNGVSATSTSSYRSVVAWRQSGAGSPAILKLSLGGIIGRLRRSLRENQIARAVVISSLFDTIPTRDRERLGLDWFAESGGVAETVSRHGWIVRRLPRLFSRTSRTSLLPAFSLISSRDTKVPILVSLIKRSRRTPERFVVDTLLRPYVNALSYLLFEQGLQYEGHPQNVLLEVDENDRPTGRLVLRDLSDTTVNIALRVAREKPLPVLPAGCRPRRAPFSLATNAADYRANYRRSRVCRGFDTVEQYGLRSFVWAINTSLGRFFRAYDASLVERRYLELWQQAAIDHLRVRPLFRDEPIGLAIDESIAYFLRHADWRSLGTARARLSDRAEPLLLLGKMRRRSGRVYDRVSCAWGDIFIDQGLPGFFRPAY